MDGTDLLGRRIVVEKAGAKRSARERRSPGPNDECFNCGRTGHW